jgi:prolipoprotein diacylglyceryltransferase
MAGGAFLTFYPIMRMICEYFRVGDDPYDWLKWTHLSAGVLLSIPMLVIGATFWIYFMCKPKVDYAAPVAPLPTPAPA